MTNKNFSIYQLKITLRGSKPPIWRRIQVNSDTTLEKLHDIIQIVMGWDGYHLHQFIIGDTYYGEPDPDFGSDIINEKRVTLASVVRHEKQSFIYEYDFGDSWEHLIVVEKIISPDKTIQYPICITGKNACPPEDCGGIWGYYDLIETLKDPKNPEYEEMLDWIGGEFDPELFDLEAINNMLKNFK